MSLHVQIGVEISYHTVYFAKHLVMTVSGSLRLLSPLRDWMKIFYCFVYSCTIQQNLTKEDFVIEHFDNGDGFVCRKRSQFLLFLRHQAVNGDASALCRYPKRLRGKDVRRRIRRRAVVDGTTRRTGDHLTEEYINFYFASNEYWAYR